MYMTRHRAPASRGTEISFPKLECWNPLARVAIIAADVNSKRVLCAISVELLQERFLASADEPMKAVIANRALIQAAAQKLIERQAYEEDGSILIRPGDI
jgi:hypothetical protein